MIDSFLTLILVAVFAFYAWIVARKTRGQLEQQIGGLERRIEELEARLQRKGKSEHLS